MVHRGEPPPAWTRNCTAIQHVGVSKGDEERCYFHPPHRNTAVPALLNRLGPTEPNLGLLKSTWAKCTGRRDRGGQGNGSLFAGTYLHLAYLPPCRQFQEDGMVRINLINHLDRWSPLGRMNKSLRFREISQFQGDIFDSYLNERFVGTLLIGLVI